MDRVEENLRQITPIVATLRETNEIARELAKRTEHGQRLRLTFTQTAIAVLAITPGIWAAVNASLK